MTFPDEMDKKLIEIRQKRELLQKKANGKLKPCPFCGGEAILKPYQHDPDLEDFWTVQCKNCFVELSMDSNRYVLTSRKHAIQAWNTRADEAEQ